MLNTGSYSLKTKIMFFCALALAVEGGSLFGSYPYWEDARLVFTITLLILSFASVLFIPTLIYWFRVKQLKLIWCIIISTLLIPVNIFLIYTVFTPLASLFMISGRQIPIYVTRIMLSAIISGIFLTVFILNHEKKATASINSNHTDGELPENS